MYTPKWVLILPHFNSVLSVPNGVPMESQRSPLGPATGLQMSTQCSQGHGLALGPGGYRRRLMVPSGYQCLSHVITRIELDDMI